MELDVALDFVRRHSRGVLATARRDGRPQLSNVVYATRGDAVCVSITATRAKYRNLLRDPAASFHVTQDDFSAYVVLDGRAQLSPVAADAHDATSDALVELYRAIAGEHPDWDTYREAMVTDRRLVLTLHPQRAYGMLGLPPASGT